MTIPAREAAPGRLYRPTRAETTAYYKVCDQAATRKLEARLRRQDVRLLRPEDRFALQAVTRVRSEGHVLVLRLLRYRDDTGGRHESRAYVAIPPDYPLREIKRPPGYPPVFATLTGAERRCPR